MTLSLFEGDRLLAFAAVAGSSTIDAVIDVDGDGRDEVVLTSGYFNHGEGSESAALVRMGRDGLVLVEDFGGVASWSDNTGKVALQTYAVAHARRVQGAHRSNSGWRKGTPPARPLERREGKIVQARRLA